MTENVYWWISGVGVFIVALLALFKDEIKVLFIKLWKRFFGIKASLFPHIFEALDKSTTGGIALKLTGRTSDPYEIIEVVLRIKGVDLATRILKGFSQCQSSIDGVENLYTKIPSKINEASVDIPFHLEHKEQLIAITQKFSGIELKQRQSIQWFVPIRCPLLEYILAFNDISIIVITTEGEKEIIKGPTISQLFAEAFRAWGNKSCDLQWTIRCKTFSTELPNINAYGAINDLPISFKINSCNE